MVAILYTDDSDIQELYIKVLQFRRFLLARPFRTDAPNKLWHDDDDDIFSLLYSNVYEEE